MAAGHRCSYRHNVCQPLQMRANVCTIVKTKQFYECERNNLCINTYTPHVAATSFFAGEVEIFDFVTERVKRCIAAKRGRGGGSLKTHNDGWNWNLIKCLGSILYEHSVVGGVVNCLNLIYGGGIHRTRRYGDVVVGVLQKNKCHIMRRDTQCPPLQMRLRRHTIYKNMYAVRSGRHTL